MNADTNAWIWAVNDGDPIGPDMMSAWCSGRNVTVWAITEGMDNNDGPILCCAGLDALRFTDAMSAAKVFAQVDLLPCCQGSLEAEGDEVYCIRDTFDDVPDNVLAVLRAASGRHGIEWPGDIAGPAPDWTPTP